MEHNVAVAYVEEGFGSCLALEVIVDARTMETEMIVWAWCKCSSCSCRFGLDGTNYELLDSLGRGYVGNHWMVQQIWRSGMMSLYKGRLIFSRKYAPR